MVKYSGLPAKAEPFADDDVFSFTNTSQGVNGSEQVEYADLRDEIRIYIPPSGDQSGATDRANIKAAILDLQANAYVGSGVAQYSILLHEGPYYIDDGDPMNANSILALGEEGVEYGNVISLKSTSQSIIQYTGVTTSRYLIGAHGYPQAPNPRIAGLYLKPVYKCRGILFSKQVTMSTLENCVISGAYEVGLDVVSSWTSLVRNIEIDYTRGVALRVWRSQTSVIDHVRIGNSTAQNWPAVDDSSVLDDNDDPVRTLANQRSFLHNHSTDIVFRSLMFERNNSGSLPLCYMSSTSRGCRFTEQMWYEANTADEKVLIEGAGINQSATRHFRFENIHVNGDNPSVQFIRTIGQVADLYVDGIYGDLVTHVIKVDGNSCYNFIVKNCALNIAEDDIITLVNGGTLSGLTPLTVDMQGALIRPIKSEASVPIIQLADADAPNNSLYFSTDQNQLVYKGSDGTLYPIANDTPIPP